MTDVGRDPQATALLGLYLGYRDAGTEAWLETRGTSMRPLVGPGGRMLVAFGATPARVGEVVVFERHNGIVAHRLVGSRRRDGREQLIVKGDNEAYFDSPIGPDDVLGVVRGVRRDASGPVSRRGLDGRTAQLIAGISRSAGRGARFARRVAEHSPAPVRRTALRAIPTLARVPTRLMLAPITQESGAGRR